MEKIVAALSCLATICVIIIGQIYWEGKIKSHVNAANTTTEDRMEYVDKIEMDSFNQLPKELEEKVKQAKQKEEKLKFVIYGSESTSTDEEAWPQRLKNELEENYGDTFEVYIYSDEGKTTHDIVNEKLYQKIVDIKPDVLLFEPFILKDNGLGINQTLENITFILEEIKNEQPNVTVYLQPAHPLYNAIYYPREVEELGQFTKDNGYIFLNHWSTWPDQDNQELLNYLTEQKDKPNESGNDVWAKYLIDYFISE